MTVRRIITVASGKGGVGKSTFALNFALTLSRVAPTALVDLDSGTSSVRNTLDAPVERDLYHFFRRNEPLDRCLTPLTDRLDPLGHFRQFSFVAAPRHAMEEMISLREAYRYRLMRALNTLPVTYVVLDMRAGLDSEVLDFMPHSNSGILVFTPHHPAATMAAADIVRALIFRKLRLVFSPEGPVAAVAGRVQLDTVNALLDSVEDPYDESISNLDAFLLELLDAFGDVPLVRSLAETVASFGVSFVLNLFDGVRESYDRALVPFVHSLQRHVSAQLALYNLGWIVTSPELHQANCRRWPLVLQPPKLPKDEQDPILAQLDALTVPVKPIESNPRRHVRDYLLEIDPHLALMEQLEVLEAMSHSKGALQVRDNFAYITRRVLHLLSALPADRFGQRRVLNPLELVNTLMEEAAATPAAASGADATPPP